MNAPRATKVRRHANIMGKGIHIPNVDQFMWNKYLNQMVHCKK
jgi:hypothetical protein